MVFGDEGGLELRKNGDLLDDILDLVFRALNVDKLDCHGLARSLVDAGDNIAQLAIDTWRGRVGLNP